MVREIYARDPKKAFSKMPTRVFKPINKLGKSVFKISYYVFSQAITPRLSMGKFVTPPVAFVSIESEMLF